MPALHSVERVLLHHPGAGEGRPEAAVPGFTPAGEPEFSSTTRGNGCRALERRLFAASFRYSCSAAVPRSRCSILAQHIGNAIQLVTRRLLAADFIGH